MSYEFDFAISFAKAQRDLAKQLADQLTAKGFRVFYDQRYQSRLLGRKLDKEFTRIFGQGTRFFLPLISKEYVDRDWSQLEWSIARKEATSRREEYILPLRIDDTLLLGLPDNVGYLDLREHQIHDVIEILAQKCPSGIRPKAGFLEPETWVVTFGLAVEDVIDLLPEQAPRVYAFMCDWLEDDLMTLLRLAPIDNPRLVEDARNGETLSVRVAFEWTPDRDALNFGELDWWEVLEIAPYEEIYDEKIKGANA